MATGEQPHTQEPVSLRRGAKTGTHTESHTPEAAAPVAAGARVVARQFSSASTFPVKRRGVIWSDSVCARPSGATPRSGAGPHCRLVFGCGLVKVGPVSASGFWGILRWSDRRLRCAFSGVRGWGR